MHTHDQYSETCTYPLHSTKTMSWHFPVKPWKHTHRLEPLEHHWRRDSRCTRTSSTDTYNETIWVFLLIILLQLTNEYCFVVLIACTCMGHKNLENQTEIFTHGWYCNCVPHVYILYLCRFCVASGCILTTNMYAHWASSDGVGCAICISVDWPFCSYHKYKYSTLCKLMMVTS